MPHETAKETSRIHQLANALVSYTSSHAVTNPFPTAIEGFTILRSDRARFGAYHLSRPALCIAAQGCKWSVFGGRRYEYRAGQALVVNVEMPARGGVSEASPAEPFLGLVIEFDLSILHEVAEQLDARFGTEKIATTVYGVYVLDLGDELLDCALRSIRLLETPEAIPVLYPGIMREICYRILTGPGGEQVFHTLVNSNYEERLIEALHTLKNRFTEPVRVDELAAIARMSPATFHRQFKSVTAMSPLQYQKQLRLLEARRLMLASNANVETAAFQVGYESASQFSREYTRMFGKSPRRDVDALREPAAPQGV